MTNLMRILTIVATVVFATLAFEYCFAYEVPADAIIKVYTKDGKEIGNMSRKDYKVVKIEEHSSKKIKIYRAQKPTVFVHYVKVKPKNNRIQLKAGVGYYDFNSDYVNNMNTITQRRAAILGVGYSRKLTEEFNLGATIHTNETFTVDAGVDF